MREPGTVSKVPLGFIDLHLSVIVAKRSVDLDFVDLKTLRVNLWEVCPSWFELSVSGSRKD